MSGCYPYSNCQCPCHKINFTACNLCSCKEDKNVSPLIEKIQQLELILNNFITRTNQQMESLFCHKVYQIDENRKISKRVDEIESSKARADVVAEKYIEIMEKIESLEAFEEDGEYAIDDLRDRVYGLEKIVKRINREKQNESL